MLEDEEAAAEGEGWVEEDLVACGDGVVFVIVVSGVGVVEFGVVVDNVHEVGVYVGHDDCFWGVQLGGFVGGYGMKILKLDIMICKRDFMGGDNGYIKCWNNSW